ncbi:MAG: hypothetical protein RL338_1385 [Chloroflexota bacterium]
MRPADSTRLARLVPVAALVASLALAPTAAAYGRGVPIPVSGSVVCDYFGGEWRVSYELSQTDGKPTLEALDVDENDATPYIASEKPGRLELRTGSGSISTSQQTGSTTVTLHLYLVNRAGYSETDVSCSR